MFLSKLSPRSFDWVLFGSTFFLVILGLAAIYSVDLSRGTAFVLFKKQVLAAGIGFALLFIASLLHYTFFRSATKAAFVGTVLLLVAVLVFGTTIRGTRGWFTFGPFSFQPVEVAKMALVLVLAYIVSHYGRRFERPLFFFGTGVVTMVLIGLVLLQPDFGSAVILGAVWFSLMLLVKARPLHIGLFVALAVVCAAVAWWGVFEPYQKERVLTFLHPERDALGSGYNSLQAIIAVGAGQFFGRGLGFGSQSQLRFLPEAQTDFIFSVIAEELGFAGVLVLLILYGVVLYRLWRIVQNARDDFIAVTVGGVALLLFIQFFVNVGANVGLLPITGVTLPLVSYGGSSLIANLLLIGIAESMVEKKY